MLGFDDKLDDDSQVNQVYKPMGYEVKGHSKPFETVNGASPFRFYVMSKE